MVYAPQNPLIVQSDRSLLLEVDNPLYASARDDLARFAELEKSPEHIHTYRITPLSLWNAASAGLTPESAVEILGKYSKFDLPGNVLVDIKDYINRFGRLKLTKSPEGDLLLRSEDPMLISEVSRNKRIAPHVLAQLDRNTLKIDPRMRGHVKQALVIFGYPAEDLAGYNAGTPLDIELRDVARDGDPFGLRAYQADAIASFWAGGTVHGGSGVIVLPCGAGKTVVGMGTMSQANTHTLILTPSTTAVRQWISELLDKTSLTADQVGEYTGEKKEIRPVTITTYQMLTYRPFKVDERTGEIGEFPHFDIFTKHDWGLIIYDEVHLLPAPIFRITAEIQARRRLGLTATLVREDGNETDVFSLIGPKKFDVPWKELEKQGWIATAECTEVRMPLTPEERTEYVLTEDSRIKYRIAAENPIKLDVLEELLKRHETDSVLVIGQYLHQLKLITEKFGAPIVTGKTPSLERDRLYEEFRSGRIKLLIVSKVANFAIDLPDANVAIQVSGTFGSRQEEAQRLGRILRPKKDGSIANFYTLVTRDTKDQDFSTNRQLFLTEQGYSYNIVDAFEIVPNLPEKIAALDAELERKKLSGEWDIDARLESRRKIAKTDEEDHTDPENKPKRGRKPKAQAQPEALQATVEDDIAAGAEDQQPPQNAGADHPRTRGEIIYAWSNSLEEKLTVVAVIGCQWGDEGKGKIVDLLGEQAGVVARCNGGPNAGHTIVNEYGTFRQRLIPSGIFNQHAVSIIGNGVVIDPGILLDEMRTLTQAGIDVSRLLISDRAHVIMPYHKLLDGLEDDARAKTGSGPIGTTRRGIGPVYVDRAARTGIRMGDLLHDDTLLTKLSSVLPAKNELLTKLYGAEPLELHSIYLTLVEQGQQLRKHIMPTELVIHRALQEKRPVLLEGAQATLLDLDFGTYPYVTSSNPTAAGLCVGSGTPPNQLSAVVGVFKAYQTRVGAGPFPTEIFGDEAEFLREQGGAGHGEYGTVTGRPRRVGWFDAVAGRYAAAINGLTGLAMTRLDALDKFDSLKICTAYGVNDAHVNHLPADLSILESVDPQYEEHPGWLTDTSKARTWADLPENARKYLDRISQLLGTSLDIISIGPHREQTIVLRNPYKAVPQHVEQLVQALGD